MAAKKASGPLRGAKLVKKALEAAKSALESVRQEASEFAPEKLKAVDEAIGRVQKQLDELSAKPLALKSAEAEISIDETQDEPAPPVAPRRARAR